MVTSLVAEIKKQFGIEPTMGTTNDDFQIVVNGKIVFSKKAAGSYPLIGEAINEIRKELTRP